MDMVRLVDHKDFMSGNFEYDFMNPPANKKTYIPVREGLLKEIKDFVKEYENRDMPLEQVRKTSYTAEEKMKWQNEMMKTVLDKWLIENRKMLKKKSVKEKPVDQNLLTEEPGSAAQNKEKDNIFKRIYRKIRP